MTDHSSHKRIVVVGGGFFGMYIADFLARRGHTVSVFDREREFMRRASYANQARVHCGYHYPRSTLTAMRSRESFPLFCEEFPDCIDNTFEKYYLIGKPLGKITGPQFTRFCRRIGAACEPAPDRITRLTNPRLVEAAFSVVEYAFNANALKDSMARRLEETGVEIRLHESVKSVRRAEGGLVLDTVGRRGPGSTDSLLVDRVFNCTYALLNQLLLNSGVEAVPLKHELTELCLVSVPEEFRNAGLTVMCGPFFSTMPFPARGLHSFSHVRYTPHRSWHDGDGSGYRDANEVLAQHGRRSAWGAMVRDAKRYVPALSGCEYHESIWEVKTVLPRSEADDSRPILFQSDCGMEGLHCVLGAKIDNVYDAIRIIQERALDR